MKKIFSVIILLASIIMIGSSLSDRAQAQSSTPGSPPQTRAPKMNVAILIWDGVQIIDYTGPYEVLGSWGRRNVYTVAETSEPITTNMGMRVIPNYDFNNQPKPDILVIPGGGLWATKSPLNNSRLIKWIQDKAKDAKYVLSVCGGALLLAKAGLLDGLEATTTAGSNIEKLKEMAPKAKVVGDKRFVDNGKIITSAGLSAGIDGALHLVSVLDGEGWAERIALSIEYNWQPDSKYARANLADMNLPSSIYESFLSSAEPVTSKGGADSWEEKWVIRAAVSPTEMLKQINKQWAKESKWSRQELTQASNFPVSAWKFTDKKNQSWNATAQVEPTGVEDKLLLTIKISRTEEKTVSSR